MDTIRSEVAHRQQADRIRTARTAIDRLKDSQDRLLAVAWPSEANLQRRGALVAQIRDAETHLRELLAVQDVERMFGLPPVLEVTDSTSAPDWRPGYPKPWLLRGGTPPQTWRLGPPARPAARRPTGKRRGGR
jgi:hypothetical protein